LQYPSAKYQSRKPFTLCAVSQYFQDSRAVFLKTVQNELHRYAVSVEYRFSRACIHFLGLVNVKWGKEKFKDLALDSGEVGCSSCVSLLYLTRAMQSPDVFRAQLFALTGVDVARQKLMFKGKVVSVSDVPLC
jgi:hypothetical protein